MAEPEAPALGLALSGGGFRAAFFHIGVLARLAELGALRNVQVISTVSGGSIVGALYYLHLKELLEHEPDGEIEDSAYCMLVAGVERELREAVRLNIRARVFSNAFKNIRMGRPSYTSSTRIGDLYDRHIYKPAWPNRRPRRQFNLLEEQIRLSELIIHPLGKDGERQGDFKPDEDNDERTDKVPILLLNATSLNTGHAWRFEAVRMGEPEPKDPALKAVVEDIDKNMRLGQGYFEEQSNPSKQRWEEERLRRFPLGIAVAASSGVPGLFPPVTIKDAYQGIEVQLVDGGVYDNQGVQGLADMGCTHMLISDGSGQMDDVKKPSTRLPAVLGRSASIPSDALRDGQLARIAESALMTREVMHLRKGLESLVIHPVSRETAGTGNAAAGTEVTASSAAFGVDHAVQEALSNIRTDLDFFSHVEASSLELDAYRMTAHVLEAPTSEWDGIFTATDPVEPEALPWRFREVAHLIGSADSADYVKKLQVGSKRFFRPMLYPGPAQWIARGLGLVAFVLLIVGFARWEFWEAVKDAANWGWDLHGVLPVLIVLLFLVALYTTKNRLSKIVFTVAGFVGALIVALPLALMSWCQVLLQPLLNRLDQIPRSPADDDDGDDCAEYPEPSPG